MADVNLRGDSDPSSDCDNGQEPGGVRAVTDEPTADTEAFKLGTDPVSVDSSTAVLAVVVVVSASVGTLVLCNVMGEAGTQVLIVGASSKSSKLDDKLGEAPELTDDKEDEELDEDEVEMELEKTVCETG